MSFELIVFLTIILVLIAVAYFFLTNDEFPIIIPAFFIATGILRYNAVVKGLTEYVRVNYAYSIFEMNDELAFRALNLFFLGTTIFFFSYIIFSSTKSGYPKAVDNQNLFLEFLSKWRLIIIALFGFFLLVNSYMKVVLSGASGIAFGYGYFFLFRLAIGGVILLVFQLYANISFQQHLPLKVVVLVVLIMAAYASYNPTTRFQFLSWMIALGIFIMKDKSPITKFRTYAILGTAVIFFFAIAGNSRTVKVENLTFQENIDLAFYRLTIAEDQNMLDGFMMVLQVYPKLLDYHLGGEHLEILMRPIPRAIWPEKPVGGYVNKLKLNENIPDTTVGISQTIYGSFYGEGGVGGIIIFSFIYGAMFFGFLRYAKRYDSHMQFILKGLIIASLIPLLRGGDLPGIVAFVGMSYWPVFLFLFYYNKFLKTKKIKYFEELHKNEVEERLKQLGKI